MLVAAILLLPTFSPLRGVMPRLSAPPASHTAVYMMPGTMLAERRAPVPLTGQTLQAALKIAFMRTLLAEMGVDTSEPTPLHVDNSGAVELSKHRKSCQRSRHVKQRYFKVRKLVAEGEIDVAVVDQVIAAVTAG